MITKKILLGLLAAGIPAASRAQPSDPLLTTWMTSTSRAYARVWQSPAAKSANTPTTTWPSAGTLYQGGGQDTPAYTDIQRVLYSGSSVYIYTSGLPSWTMGPWSAGFPNWPSDRDGLTRFPRTPSISTSKTATQGPDIAAVAVTLNGVALFNCLDGQSYSVATGQVSFNGDRYWNRTAPAGEGATMDMNNAHQQGTGVYHSHHNPLGMRYLVGDHITYSAATGTYAESSAAVTAHSPLLGWAVDGLPVYGPYGYADPTSASSGVRRMVSGFQLRDGSNGTTNLTATGRTTLPAWAANASGSSTTLSANDYGPAVSASYPLGTFGEDFDYLGDHGKVLGTDFDLNPYNARYCVTPEYPNGTWAYFVTLDANANAAFPYIFGYQFMGAVPASVTNITESVTEFVRAGQASPIAVTAVASGGSVVLTWTSVEGATYSVATSSDNTTFTPLAGAVLSAGGASTTYTTSTVADYYQVTLTALATYDTDGTGGVSGIGNTATAATPIGSSGTAKLVNLATRVQIGGAAGTPICGFVLSGTGSEELLLRAVGPGLASYGVDGFVADPTLVLVSNSVTLASNDNWAAADAATFAAVGAFALPAGSLDSALITSLSAGAYSAVLGANSGGSGIALLELYDADSSGTGPSLANASTLAYVGTGDAVLIPGLVVSGTGTVNLLIRAVGPGLAGTGVADLLADPEITLYSGATVIASNDNWSSAANATAVAAAAASSGAFALAAGSKDAALLVSLGSGAYSATVSGVGNTTGNALVEVYVVP